MDNATWTIAPCPAGGAADARATSSGSARRSPPCSCGAGTPIRPRRGAFLEGALPGPRPARARRHGRGGRARSAPPSTAGRRICVHGDYDADGICATALAVFLLRELGADPVWHLPSRFEEGYGLAAQTIARLAERRRRARAHRRLRHHRRRRGRGGDAARPRGRRHRPPPARRRVPRLSRSSPRSRATTRSPGSAARRSSGSSPRRSSAPGHPFLDRHLDVVALATVADVVPLVDESRALALAGPAPPRPDAEARACRR